MCQMKVVNDFAFHKVVNEFVFHIPYKYAANEISVRAFPAMFVLLLFVCVLLVYNLTMHIYAQQLAQLNMQLRGFPIAGIPTHEVFTSSVFKLFWFLARVRSSKDETGSIARSHNLIVPSAEHVAKEAPPEQPLAIHARYGSCMF